MNKMLGLVAMLFVLTIFTSYTFGILAENDNQINVTNTSYEDSYESNVKVQTTTLKILTPFSYLIGVGLVMVGIKFLTKK